MDKRMNDNMMEDDEQEKSFGDKKDKYVKYHKSNASFSSKGYVFVKRFKL